MILITGTKIIVMKVCPHLAISICSQLPLADLCHGVYSLEAIPEISPQVTKTLFIVNPRSSIQFMELFVLHCMTVHLPLLVLVKVKGLPPVMEQTLGGPKRLRIIFT